MEHKGDTCNRYRDDLLDCFHTRSLLFDVVLSPATCAGRDPRAPPHRAMHWYWTDEMDIQSIGSWFFVSSLMRLHRRPCCVATVAPALPSTSWHFLDRWHFVAAVVRGFLRKVVAQREVELPWRGRQPVGLLLRTRRLGLQVDVERPVGVELERHPRGDGVAVEDVHHVEVALVLRHGPGAVGRRELVFLETHHVRVGAV